MKRRGFNLTAACSAAALAAGLGLPWKARAALTTSDADTLKSTLTPFGAERAGNADGSIPAWTGGMSAMPPGAEMVGGLLPDFFAGDTKVLSIDASNVSQHTDRLSDGVVYMINKYPGFRIDVYPTHRTASAPQGVYDNAYMNVTRAVSNSQGARMGFSGAYGGPPFPIPDPNDPLEAGAQIMWNHNVRWEGVYNTRWLATHTMINGDLTLTTGAQFFVDNPFYFDGGSPETFKGFYQRIRAEVHAPPTFNGEVEMEYYAANALTQPNEIWEYLQGQGRIRKAPELAYDTPQPNAGDIVNYDEIYIWLGPLNQYDWKCVGKKEVYIPYNNNGVYLKTPEEALLANYIDPGIVRWELHRVWVVDATLHPGERNVVPRRRFYVDEDTWTASLAEEYDAQDNMWKVDMTCMEVAPIIPATHRILTLYYNVQSHQYCSYNGAWNVSPYNNPQILTQISPTKFDPQTLASNAQF